MYKTKLIQKLTERSATIGIVGLGYVGLPLLLRFAEVGYSTVGFDIDDEKIRRIRRGSTYIKHISHESIARAVREGMQVTADFSRCKEVDALIICVPTPLNKYREPDLSFVIGTVESVLPHMRAGQILSLESTTYPGTTEEELLPRLEARGFEVGRDVFLIFSPEREDPANPSYETKTIPKVCGGITTACLEVGLSLYGKIIDSVVPVSSAKAAEMTKLLENIHRAVNIGLVNEMKVICDKMRIDIHEVIRAAATKPFGFVPYYPGPGLGGHCIPIDPFYLTWKAREYGVHTRFIELAGEVNSQMPAWVIDKVAEALNNRGKPLLGTRILMLGIAYKKNVDDMRESPAVAMMEILRKKGVIVQYADPHVPVFPKMREHSFELSSTALDKNSIADFDCVIVATNHDEFDYDLIKRHAVLIVDTRGVYLEPASNVVKA